MKMNICSQGGPAETQDRATKLLQTIWATMQAQEMRSLSQSELCKIMGISEGTFINWTTQSTQLHQIEALLQLLERLPDSVRCGVLARFWRVRPIIESPRLAHELAAVSQLRMLWRERRGLTFISGGSDATRTFLFTALGHSLAQMAATKTALSGIDRHLADWFVPVGRLMYVLPSLDKNTLLDQIEKAWQPANQGSCRMFNGVWLLVPQRQEELLNAAVSHHVVVADGVVPSATQLRAQLRWKKYPIRFLDLTGSEVDRIQIKFSGM